MPDKLREITYCHNIQLHLGQSEYFEYHWLRALALFDVTSFPAIFRASDVISSTVDTLILALSMIGLKFKKLLLLQIYLIIKIIITLVKNVLNNHGIFEIILDKYNVVNVLQFYLTHGPKLCHTYVRFPLLIQCCEILLCDTGAQEAIKTMQHTDLDGHVLELKISNRTTTRYPDMWSHSMSLMSQASKH